MVRENERLSGFIATTDIWHGTSADAQNHLDAGPLIQRFAVSDLHHIHAPDTKSVRPLIGSPAESFIEATPTFVRLEHPERRVDKTPFSEDTLPFIDKNCANAGSPASGSDVQRQDLTELFRVRVPARAHRDETHHGGVFDGDQVTGSSGRSLSKL
jgi:hypothetical protein